MAATTWQQTWQLYKYGNNEIVLSGPSDASGFTLKFEIATSPTATPILEITPTIATTTITITLTLAQMTSTLTADTYQAALWRTDSGSQKPLAAGTLEIVTVPYPR